VPQPPRAKIPCQALCCQPMPAGTMSIQARYVLGASRHTVDSMLLRILQTLATVHASLLHSVSVLRRPGEVLTVLERRGEYDTVAWHDLRSEHPVVPHARSWSPRREGFRHSMSCQPLLSQSLDLLGVHLRSLLPTLCILQHATWSRIRARPVRPIRGRSSKGERIDAQTCAASAG
jgi:hypothetical protein